MTTIFDPNQTPLASIGYQNIPNIIDNGGFEIWQRGTSFSNPAINTYTADRWKVSVTGAPSWVVSRDSTAANVDSGTYSMSVNITSVGGSTVFNHFQNIENFADYRGKTLTVSMRVKATVAAKIQIRIEADASTTYSSFHSGSGNFETLTATLLIPTNASEIDIQAGFVGNSTPVATQFWLDSAMLITGSTAATFVPTNPQVDLARCQRFYEIGTISSVNLPIANITNVRTEIDSVGTFRVTKRIAPSMTMTTTQSTQVQLAPGAFGTVVDSTALWTPTGVATVDGFTFSANRGSNTTYPLLQYSATWTASADL